MCEAAASASSRSPKPSASAAPDSTSGSAWTSLTAERGKIGRAVSPIDDGPDDVIDPNATYDDLAKLDDEPSDPT